MDLEAAQIIMLYVSVFFNVLLWVYPGFGRCFRVRIKRWASAMGGNPKFGRFFIVIVLAFGLSISCFWHVRQSKKDKVAEQLKRDVAITTTGLQEFARQYALKDYNAMNSEYQERFMMRCQDLKIRLYNAGAPNSDFLNRGVLPSNAEDALKIANELDRLSKQLPQ